MTLLKKSIASNLKHLNKTIKYYKDYTVFDHVGFFSKRKSRVDMPRGNFEKKPEEIKSNDREWNYENIHETQLVLLIYSDENCGKNPYPNGIPFFDQRICQMVTLAVTVASYSNESFSFK